MDDIIHILVVDDDDVDRMAVYRALRAVGPQLRISEVTSGADAFAELQRASFDCVVLDYRLPDYDGMEVLLELRSADITVPVIMLTGQGDEALAVELMKAGAADYLPKGRLSSENLSQSVRNAVRLYRSHLYAAQAEDARRRAEEALRKSEQMLATTLRSIGDAVIATDAAGNVTFVNAVAETLTGWSAADAVGRPLDAIFHIINHTTRAPVESPVVKALREGTVVGLANHTVLIARDGTERPIDDSGAPIRNENGEMIGVVMTFHDITERQQAEHALRESEARFRSMADSAPVLLWMADNEERYFFFNQVWLAFRGRSTEQEAGDGWLEGVYPEDRQRCIDIYHRAFQQRTSFEREYRLQRADGEYRWIVDVGTPRFTPDGLFVGYIGSCSDTTNRKRAEERLRFLADASRVLADSLDYTTGLTAMARLAVPLLADWCAVDVIDEHGTLQRVAVAAHNPALEAIEHEIQQRYPIEPHRPYGASAVLRNSKPQVVTDVTDAVLHAMARDDEHLALLRARELHSFISVPLIARERVLGVITLASSKGGRRYTVEDVAFTEDLGRRVAGAVDNAILYHAANDAVRARDAFLSIAAHELKTPLTSLLGYADLLRRRAERDGMEGRDLRAVRVIADQGARLNRMISSLLDLSRIQTGQLSIERSVVDLVALAQRLVDEVQPTIERHTLALHLPDAPVLIEGDELRLEQVFQNLLQNAIKYSPAGGVVTIAVTQRDHSGCFAVTDTGMGIPEASLPQLFSRFYRASNVDTQRISGMGVGLYVVKEIVTLHGGTVEVTSREGAGSTFTVCLPLATSTLPEG